MSSDQRPPLDKLISQLVQADADLRDVVEEFVEGLATRLTELREAHDRLDWEQLTMLAHRLKGAGGSYGYPDISQLCATMEQGFRAHQDADFNAWLARLEELAAAAVAGLRDGGE